MGIRDWEYWKNFDATAMWAQIVFLILFCVIVSVSSISVWLELIPAEIMQIPMLCGIAFFYGFLAIATHPKYYKEKTETSRVYEILGFGEEGRRRSLFLWCSLATIPVLLWLVEPRLVFMFWLGDTTVWGGVLMAISLYLIGEKVSGLTDFMLRNPNDDVSWTQIFADESTWLEERKALEGGIDKCKATIRLVIAGLAIGLAYWVNNTMGYPTVYNLPLDTVLPLYIIAATLLAYVFWAILFFSLLSIIFSNITVFGAFERALSDFKKLKIFKFLGSVEAWVRDDCPKNRMNEVMNLLEAGTNHYGVYLRVGLIRNRFRNLLAIFLLAAIFPIVTIATQQQPVVLGMMIIGLLGPYLIAFSFLGVEMVIHRVLTMSQRAFLDLYSLLLERENVRYLAYEGAEKRLGFLKEMVGYSKELPVWTFNYGSFAAWGVTFMTVPIIQFMSVTILSMMGIG